MTKTPNPQSLRDFITSHSDKIGEAVSDEFACRITSFLRSRCKKWCWWYDRYSKGKP